MRSWIYVFSKFTPEALLLEVAVIFMLIAGYAAFWILKKRKLGAAEHMVPSSVVKLYLSELIGEAHDMRTQLFGLLGAGALPNALTANGAAFVAGLSGMDGQKLTGLESKMSEQAAAIEKILAEKAKLEKELSEAQAKGGGAGAGSNDDLKKLNEKCQGLEARLAEYSVIEDDLANLKRLQQENAQLKIQLGGNAGGAASPSPQVAAGAAAAASPPARAAAAPAPAQPATSTEKTTLAPTTTPEASFEMPAESTAAASPGMGALEAATTDATFEGLVDEVEKSLQPTTPAAPAGASSEAAANAAAAIASAPPQPAAAAEASAANSKPPAAPVEKSDEDLIAEFEKMLNS